MRGDEPVSKIMTKRVLTVDMDRPLSDVQKIFLRVAFHHLVVVEDRKVVGIVSDRDLFKAVSPFAGTMEENNRDRNTLRRHVHQIMTRAVQTASPATTVAEVTRKMIDGKFSCVPVVDENMHCLGVVTLRDVASKVIEKCLCQFEGDEQGDQPIEPTVEGRNVGEGGMADAA